MRILKRICLSAILAFILSCVYLPQAQALHGVCVFLLNWEVSTEPEQEKDALFPVAFYVVATAPTVQYYLFNNGKYTSGDFEPGIATPHYIGYFILGKDLSLAFIPKTKHPIIGEYFTSYMKDYATDYEGKRKNNPKFSFELAKEVLSRQFTWLLCRHVFIIQGKPGAIDDDFIPEFDEHTVIHSLNEASQATDIPTLRAFNFSFNIQTPTNLKPGMRVLMPVRKEIEWLHK